MKLRPYQNDTIAAITAAFKAGQTRQVVKSPTGTGKTVMFAALRRHRELVAALGGHVKMLVIAHREELLEQAAKKILASDAEAHVTIEQADRYASRMSDVVIASIQTLQASKFKRLHRLIGMHDFNLVVVDEAHHAAAPSYRTALAHLGVLPMADASDDSNAEAADFKDLEDMQRALQGWDQKAPKNKLLVGVTATPNRSDAIGLGCVFQTISYSYALRQAIADQWLVPIVPWAIETATSLDAVRVNRGEFNQRELADTVNTSERNQIALAAWKQYAEGRSTLAFTVDVQHAHDLAKVFTNAGVSAAALSGETPKEERRHLLQRFMDRDLTVLTNCMVLTEGTDLPVASCILHAKPTKSATLYEQMTGRGLRLSEATEKVDCVVIDIVDIARRHSLQAAPVLYGLPPGLHQKGLDLDELAEEYEALQAAQPGAVVYDNEVLTLDALKARAATFDIWNLPDLGPIGEGLSLNWIKMGPEDFRLQFPAGENIELIQVGMDLLQKFEVRLKTLTRVAKKMVTLAEQVIGTAFETVQEALRAAEQFVRLSRPSAARLKDTEASWRSRPASAKQLSLLHRLKAPVKKGLTSGEASDMIDLAMSRRGRR